MANAERSPADEVDPNIGTIGHLLTAAEPTVALPYGMMRAVPVTARGLTDRYLSQRLYGFAAGPVTLAPAGEDGNPLRDGWLYDHDWETVSPYFYSVWLEDADISAEYTVTAHAAFFRFRFPAGGNCRICLSLPPDTLRAAGAAGLGGVCTQGGVRHYVSVEFTRPPRAVVPLPADGGCATAFAVEPDEWLGVKIGISLIGPEQADRSRNRELGGKPFGQVRGEARARWNRALGAVTIRGGTRAQRTVFYTALYRSLLHMVSISEDGRYFSGFDGAVHCDGGRPFYNVDNIWDTYRTMHPLQMLLEPSRQTDMVRSYLAMYDQCGWLPRFPDLGGDRPIMIGNHTAALFADTLCKGGRDFDLEKAYEAAAKNARARTMLPWALGPATSLDRFYQEKGYFPALDAGEKETVPEVHVFEKRQAVSVTLEQAYDDWCTAQLAGALGRGPDRAFFLRRAQNYRKVYHPETGFMAPRTAAGGWVRGFDPALGGGQGGRDYFTECNSWIYTFFVPHDIGGLTGLLGGKAALEQRLDRLFSEPLPVPKYEFLARFPDETGLMGHYCQGNEPAFAIPYLYNYAGAPWKTQRRVREIMKLWFRPDPLGICGDEDAGAMSAWYVFSAMGFYPVCPGRPRYDLGSPLFEQTDIRLETGGTFTIRAENVSEINKYIQSASLDGRPLAKPWFCHDAVTAGGTLILQMGPRPNRLWGTGD